VAHAPPSTNRTHRQHPAPRPGPDLHERTPDGPRGTHRHHHRGVPKPEVAGSNPAEGTTIMPVTCSFAVAASFAQRFINSWLTPGHRTAPTPPTSPTMTRAAPACPRRCAYSSLRSRACPCSASPLCCVAAAAGPEPADLRAARSRRQRRLSDDGIEGRGRRHSQLPRAAPACLPDRGCSYRSVASVRTRGQPPASVPLLATSSGAG